MSQETKKLLAVNVLYAMIPVLLVIVPLLLRDVQMETYGVSYNAYMVLTEFGIIVLPTLIYFLTPWGKNAVHVLWAEKPTASILLMIPLAICAYFLMNGVTTVWLIVLQQFGIAEIPQTVPAPQTGAQLGIGLAVIALSPALCEEFFFRGVLQPTLHRGLKPWVAVVLGGCMFGMVHGQVAAFPAHVLLGMGLCLAAYWTRSIWYTAVWHLIQNGIAVILSYFSEMILQASESMTGMDSAAMLAEQPLMMLMSAVSMIMTFGVGTAVCMILLWFCTRKNREQPLEAAEEKIHILAYAPLVVALGCIVYMYITDAIMLSGGGV